MKLKHAKQILDGLTSADFEKIRESAGVMNTFGNLENRACGRNPEYRTQLNFFRRENRELIRQVDKKTGRQEESRRLDAGILSAHVQLCALPPGDSRRSSLGRRE